MPTRLRKIRKFRGSRSHGWGQSAGHRGSGSHGGYGKTGGHKHGWTYVLVYDSNRFGKHGFYRKNIRNISMNIGELDQVADSLLFKGQAIKKEEGILVDLESLGVDKLLGSGRVNKPLLVRVRAFSASADKKIRDAKGQIINVE